MTEHDRWNGRTVLMESGDWVLVPPRRPVCGSNLLSLPIHRPCGSGCAVGNKEGHHVPACGVCKAPVPEDMEAAYILHNWEIRERL